MQGGFGGEPIKLKYKSGSKILVKFQRLAIQVENRQFSAIKVCISECCVFGMDCPLDFRFLRLTFYSDNIYRYIQFRFVFIFTKYRII